MLTVFEDGKAKEESTNSQTKHTICYSSVLNTKNLIDYNMLTPWKGKGVKHKFTHKTY